MPSTVRHRIQRFKFQEVTSEDVNSSSIFFYSRSLFETSTIFCFFVGFLGELSRFSDRTLVVKDHLFNTNIDKKYHSLIFIVRNPYDAYVAEFNRQHSNGHVGHAAEKLFATGKRYAVKARTALNVKS